MKMIPKLLSVLLTSLRGKLVLIFLATTIGGVAVSTGYTRYQQNQFTLTRAQELATEDLRLISSEIQTVLQWVVRDLLVLRDLPQLGRFLEQSSSPARSELLESVQAAFRVIAEHHKIYHQVRYLNEEGQEVIRINFDGRTATIVPPGALQNKSHRYYFQESRNLKKGQIYASPMDLNIEHGRIEKPFVPTIRYATPIFNLRGQPRGIIALNVLGTSLLQVLQRQQKQVRHHGKHYFLVNARGFYLFHPDPKKTFGFMLNTDERWQRHEPQLMEIITGSPQQTLFARSAVSRSRTLFAIRQIPLWTGPAAPPRAIPGKTADPPSGKNSGAPGQSQRPSHWTLISTQNEAQLLAGPDDVTAPFLAFTLLLLAGCTLVAVFVGLSVSKPVVSLAAAARNIHDGDLTARAQVFSRDEMGRFGHLFNRMAGQLQETVRRLRLSETKYRTIFENSRDSQLVIDTDGRIVDLNQSGAELLGIDLTPGHQIDVPFPWAAENTRDFDTLCKTIATEGFVKNYEVHVSQADGAVRVCLLTASAQRNAQGLFVSFEGALRDITERRRRIRARRQFQKRLQEEIVMAEERERRRLGQVLHEELAQNLALASLKIQESAAEILPAESPIKIELDETLVLLSGMIDRIRTMIFDLYPAMMDEQGLIPTMNWYAQTFTVQTGLPVTLYPLATNRHLTRPHEVYLFRAFKELLHNVWKHAQAREIVVTVVAKEGQMRLVVDDDGQGFDYRTAFEVIPDIQGIGLISIREWVTAMEGRFSVESRKSKGTRVMIEIPLDPAET